MHLRHPHQHRALWLRITTVSVLLVLTLQISASGQTDVDRRGMLAYKPSPAARRRRPATSKTRRPPVSRLKIEVPCRAWVPEGQLPKVVLLCVHGLGLNSGSYEAFGKKMSNMGIATFAVDVRGFGTWMKVQGKQKVDFDSCIDDVKQAIVILHKAYPGIPVFILGESMGGAIALRFTAMYPDLVAGLISAVPSGDRFQQGKTELNVAMHMLEGWNRPMNIGAKVIKQATDDPNVAKSWSEDPYNRQEISPKELIQFQNFMNDNHDIAEKITNEPVLMIQGFKDRLVKPKGTVELFNEIASPDKLLIVVGDREHLIFEENQFTDEVIWVVLGWLKSKVEKSKP